MPFDGTGNYSPPSPPTFPAVNGEVIRSDYFNAIITDIANSLTLTFTKDGQSAPTAELDFNNQNLTNIDALDATSVDALNYFINGDLLDYTAFSQDFISSTDANSARAKLGLSAGTDSGLVSGGQVVWETGYQFRVSAAVYLINGIQYTSAEQTVTLTAADGSLDRIDVLYLDTAGLVGALTGTAAALPTEPDIEFGTQIKLTFVFVQAASSAPAEVVNTDIYLENTEWTSSTSGTGFNANSTNNPYAGTKCIEGTSVANNAYVQLQAGAPITLDNATNLSMFIRSKAAWTSGRVLRVQWYLNGVAKGIPLTIASGYWGFNSATLAYQLVAIPIAQFVLPAETSVNQLRITDSGGAIGFYIDNIILQAQGTDLDQNGEDYVTQGEADARYVPLTYLDTDTTLAANSDTKIATQKAVKAYVDANAGASGDITTSGLTMATGKILGRDTAATGAIEELSLSEVLDLIGSAAQGDILYRGASSWSRLGAGTAGQILRTNGASQNPAWATLSGGGTDAGVFETSPAKPLLAGFTLENAGTASAADGTFGIVLTMPSSTVNVRFLRYTAGLPGSSWDVRIRSSLVTPYATSNIHHGCILLRNSGTGRIVTFAQNNANVLSQNWASYTAFASGVFSFPAVYGLQGFWKRITCDGTNLTFFTSANGVDWAQVGAVTLAAYISSVDQIGLGTINGAASGVTNADVFESFTLT